MRKDSKKETAGNEHATNLDVLGMELALKARIERRIANWNGQGVTGAITSLESLQDLLKRDKERQQDGFPSKIKFRRVLAANNRVVNVPYVDEEKLFHGSFEPKGAKLVAQTADFLELPDIDEATGHGDGDVGDVIGEVPMPGRGGGGDDGDEGDGNGSQPGAGDEDADHALEEEAYELGRRLMEQLKLPNLKDKARKVPTDEYTYDLTDRHRGSGQVLDKKETLRRVVKTNLILGRIEKDAVDTRKMIVSPGDLVFRVLSRERVWKAQALACFLRDYSGSMWGDPTKALVSQHLMIYAWLLVQYEKRVIPRFFVHDHNAREVSAKEYFGLGSYGGTLIASGYKKINEVVEGEGLENDYNIYVFQGTDGDDGDEGEFALPELNKILNYVSRMGVTLFKHPYYTSQGQKTIFEQYIEKGGILERKDVFRMHTMPRYTNVTEEMNVEALRTLIAQD